MYDELPNPLTAGTVIGPIKEPAFYRGDEVERGDPSMVIGRSTLMEFNRNPARWKSGFKESDSDATDWGTLVDCLALTPEQFKMRYAVAPTVYIDAKTKEEKPWNWNANVCKEWREQQGGKQVLKNSEYQAAVSAVQMLHADEEVKAMLSSSQKQVMATASYTDKETGITVPLKILIDLLPDVRSQWGKSIVDLKTCQCGAMRPWVRSVSEWSLDCQAALYLDVWTANTGEERLEFRHIVQESFAPYHVTKRLLSVEFIEIGRQKYLNALQKYCQCLKTGVWPGYPCGREIDGWQLTEPEPWMIQ